MLRWLKWLGTPRSKLSGARVARRSSRAATHRTRNLRVEQLEGRALLSTLPAGFQETYLTAGVNPTGMDFAPDGHLFIADKGGDIRVLDEDTLLPTPFHHFNVDVYRDRGLIAVAVDPNFEQNGFVYALYTAAVTVNPDSAGNGAITRLVRLKASAANHHVSDPASLTVIVDGIPSYDGIHQGGFLHFGIDGMLYAGIGETAIASNAQDLSNIYGKILRLDVANYPNIIPADNPFVGQPGKRGEIWAYGFRNPFSGNIDPVTGEIYVNDVGNDLWEEVNEVEKGKNYGWPLAEGNSSNPAFTNPLFTYSHAGAGAAITGGVFYRGDMFPADYLGDYLFSDLVQNNIRDLEPILPGELPEVSLFGTNVRVPTAMAQAPDGSLYWGSFQPGANGIYRISYSPQGNRAPTAVAAADATDGLSPIVVNFSGALSTDPDQDLLTYAWDFGDGATATGRDVTHTYANNGVYEAVLTVSDRPTGGLSNSAAAIIITVGNRSPQPVITLPLASDLYQAGQTISFAGTANDPDDGPLPEDAFEWSFLFGHNTHFHEFIPPIRDVTTGSFPIDTGGETSPDQYYRIFLTVTDSGGLSRTIFRDIRPQLSLFTLASNLPGASLLLDSQPGLAPLATTGVVGMTRTIEAPLTQMIGGQTYQFVSWSDGGAAQHSINTLASPTTYTATYRPVLEATYLAAPPTQWTPGQAQTYSVTVTNTGTVTWPASGVNRVRLGVYFDAPNDNPYTWLNEPSRYLLPGNVAPGQSATILVNVPAPAVAGRYTLRTRLVQEEIAWFNQLHKVEVANGFLLADYTTNLPALWTAGETKSFAVNVTNTGNQTWNATGPNLVQLGLYFDAPNDLPGSWSAEPLRFELPGDVAPGQTRTINLTLTAPTAPGEHVLRMRMVQDQVGWSDQVGKRTITVGVLASQISSTVPLVLDPNLPTSFSVTVQNTGTVTWSAGGANPVKLGAYFDAPSDDIYAWPIEPFRFNLPSDVAPGASVTIPVTLDPLVIPGEYVLRLRMVKEFVTWFSQLQTTTITVGSLAASYVSSPPTLAEPGQTQTFTTTVTNTGTVTWQASGTNRVQLAVYYDGTSDAVGAWSSNPLRIPLTADLAPGQSQTLTVNIAAPLVPGSYTLRQRMVKEGVAWFDQLAKQTVTVSSGLAASYTTTAPASWGRSATKVFTTTVTNTGTATWQAGGTNPVRLAVYFDGTSDAVGAWTTDPLRVPLTTDLAPGQSQTLTVTIVSPATSGSYVLRQRMVKEGVTWFTQIAKTNVTVAQNALAASYTATPAANWQPKETRTFSVTVTNTGTQTWNRTGTNPVRLGATFTATSDAPGAWPAEPVRFSLPSNVAPGQSATISVTLAAPLASGSYVLRLRLVKENVGWFDYLHKTNITVTTLAAAYSGTIPTTWTPGQTRTYSLTVTNTGTTTWNTTGTNPVRLGVYFGGASDTPGTGANEPRRMAWPTGVTSVAPGQSVTLTVTMRAPTAAGSYVLRHRMVKENITWFADMLRTDVSVAAAIVASTTTRRR